MTAMEVDKIREVFERVDSPLADLAPDGTQRLVEPVERIALGDLAELGEAALAEYLRDNPPS